jgi:hypothetical protein
MRYWLEDFGLTRQKKTGALQSLRCSRNSSVASQSLRNGGEASRGTENGCSGEEGEEYKVKEAFYRCVASRVACDQAIILENETPPAGLGANVISFTKSDHGRYGFLPSRRAESAS